MVRHGKGDQRGGRRRVARADPEVSRIVPGVPSASLIVPEFGQSFLGASQRLPGAPCSAQSAPHVFLRVGGAWGGIEGRKVSGFRVLYSLRIRECLSVNRDSPKWGRVALGYHGDPLWLPAEASQRCPCLS